ncbi:facilitated trehalose transporter Tret1-like isoform X1 [Diabrotica undecimpunctata]|uniref:facilitated trehalose transporter Tret1-like isoform X1 n=2 Tax=Diabrotica undecimpunctata TaxID=50387 RepID=UPI003B63CFD6
MHVFCFQFNMSGKTNYFLHWAAFTVNILTLATGITMSWASPSLLKLESLDPDVNPLGRPITTAEKSLIASLPTFTSVPGTIIAGFVSQKLGRKKTLIIFSLPFLFCYIGIALAKSVAVFYVTRFLLGISCGCTLAVLPSYVAEISEDSNRGFLGCIMGIMGAIGYFIVYAIGPVVSIQMFAYLQLIPIILFYVMFIPFIPESPYYFVAKKLDKEAEACLKKIRTTSKVHEELAYLEEVINENKEKKSDWREIYSTKAARKGLTITCGLLMFQQLLGFMAVLNYMQSIFEAAKTSINSNTASLILGGVQIISNIFSTLLVDRLGRKVLLLSSNVGCTISLAALGAFFFCQENNFNTDAIFWLPILSLIVFFVSFNFGFGTLPLTVCGELFSSNIKAMAASLSTCVCLLLAFLVTLGFPYLSDAVGRPYTFWIFGITSVFSILFVVFIVPETKGKSFKEIQYVLEGKR